MDQYQNYEASQGLLPKDARGGLYRGYLLACCFSVKLLQLSTALKRYYNYLLVAIYRGIAILGSALCYVLDPTMINELTTLRCLCINYMELIDRIIFSSTIFNCRAMRERELKMKVQI